VRREIHQSYRGTDWVGIFLRFKKSALTSGSITPLFAVASLLLALFCYWPGLNAALVSDGYSLVVNPGVHQDPLARHFIVNYAGSGYYRPLATLSLDLTVRLFGKEPPAHHLLQVLLHWAAGLALFGIARRLLKNDLWAGLAGLLFVLHPLATHTLIWVGDRTDALAVPLFLAAILCFLRSADDRGGHPRLWTAFGGLALLASLLAKETGIIALILVPFLVWTVARREVAEGSNIRRTVIIAALGAAVPILLIYLWRWLWGLGGGLPINLTELPQRLAYYLLLLPGFPPLKGVDGLGGLIPALVPALVFYALLFWAVWRAARRGGRRWMTTALSSVPGVCFVWLVVSLVPVSFKFNLWYFYFLLPPAVLATVWLLRRVWSWRKPVAGLAAVLLFGYYMAASVNTGVQWRRAAEAGDRLTGDILAHSDTIERCGGLVLMSVPWNYTERANPLPLAIYNYAWGMELRLEHALGFPVDYSAASYTVVDNLDSWSYRTGYTDDVLWQGSEHETFEATPIEAYFVPDAEVAGNEVCLPLPMDRPVFALDGDGYVPLYDPPLTKPERWE